MDLCPEGCSTYTFPKILGKSKANEMLLLNYKMSAAEAYKFGMISNVYKKDELETILWPKLFEHAKLSKESLNTTKKLMTQLDIEHLDAVCDRELIEMRKRIESAEFSKTITKLMQRKSNL